MSEAEINLGSRPDGLFYGTARFGSRVVRVNVLPPEYLWEGDNSLDDTRPDPTHWQVFADGELIGRIARQEDVGPALLHLLIGQ